MRAKHETPGEEGRAVKANAPARPDRLTPEEIADLRRDAAESSAWMKEQLRREAPVDVPAE